MSTPSLPSDATGVQAVVRTEGDPALGVQPRPAVVLDGVPFFLDQDHDEQRTAEFLLALPTATAVAFHLTGLLSDGWSADAVKEEADGLRRAIQTHRPEFLDILADALGALDSTYRAPLREYTARGYQLTRVNPRDKTPIGTRWSIRPVPLDSFQVGDPLGIICGPISGRPGHSLVCIDLDSPAAVSHGDEFLPSTGMVEGRRGKPRSHWYYQVPHDSIPVDHWSDAEQSAPHARAGFGHAGPRIHHLAGPDGNILDLLGTGAMAVCPPTRHHSGENREWEGGFPGEPAVVPFEELSAAVTALASACGWLPHSDRRAIAIERTCLPVLAPRVGDDVTVDGRPYAHADRLARARGYLEAIIASGDLSRSGFGGHNTFFRHMCTLATGFALTDEESLSELAACYNDALARLNQAYPGAGYELWNEAELDHKITDAIREAKQSSDLGHLLPPSPPTGGDDGDSSEAGDDGRQRIRIGVDEHRVNDAAVCALAGHPDVYQCGGRLVRMGRRDGTAATREVSRYTLRELLTASADWEQSDRRGTGWVPAHPPDWCVGAVLDRGEWPAVRPLAGVVSHPVLRPDGSALTTRGYDDTTGLFLAGAPVGLCYPARPTREDAIAAVAALSEVVCDYRFSLPSDRSAWIAFVLTRLARHAFTGAAPVFMIGANTPGTGKSLMATAANAIVTGERDVRTMGYCHGKDEELAKKVNSFAMRGETLVQFGNVSGSFGSPVLDEAITSGRWGDRVLGRNTISDARLDGLVWAANGNNVVLVGDTPRRVLQIDISTDLEHPESRGDFRHPRLIDWVLDARPRLLSAAFTILVAYDRAGRPDMQLPPWGSFESWSDLVRSAIVWAGMPDPGESRATSRGNTSPELAAVRIVVARWQTATDGRPRTVGDVIAAVFPRDSCGRQVTPTDPDLAEALRIISPSLHSKRIGEVLGKYRGRTLDGCQLVQSGTTGGSVRWTTQRVDSRD